MIESVSCLPKAWFRLLFFHNQPKVSLIIIRLFVMGQFLYQKAEIARKTEKATKDLVQFILLKSIKIQSENLDTYQSSDGYVPIKQIPENDSELKLKNSQVHIQELYEYQLDERKPVKSYGNQYDYPFRSIGYITSIFSLGNQIFDIKHGTGFLIQKNVVLTSAHNLCNRDLKRKADQVIFIPALNGNRGSQIFIKQNYLRFPQQFISEKEQYKKFDYAILYLGQVDLSQTYGYLGFDTKKNNLEKQVLLFGYPQDKQKQQHRQHQFGMGGVVKKQDQSFLYYHICTNTGQSGSPIIKCSKEGVYKTVGIHTHKQTKGEKDKEKEERFNIGLRFTENIRNNINDWIREMQTNKKQEPILAVKNKESQAWDQIQALQIKKDDILNYEQKFKKQMISDDIVRVLLKQTKTQFKKLRKLDLSDLELTSKGLINIYSCQSKLKNLEELFLCKNQIGNEGIEHLTRNQNVFKDLRYLYLRNNKIGNEGIEYLTRNQNVFKDLRQLQLNNNQIGKEGIEHLTRNSNVFKNLEIIFLSDNQIGSEGIKNLTRNQNMFKNLQYLQLNNNQIDNEGIGHLTRNPNLFKNLKYLYLNKNYIGNQAIEYLTHNQNVFQTLEILYLNSNQIGNEGIQHLTRNQNVLKNLACLFLNENKFQQNKKGEYRQLLRKHYKSLYAVQLQ